MVGYKATGLWKRSLGRESNPTNDDAYSLLKGTYQTFRERAAALTSKIANALPNLTIHDITHLDALWETADLIAGDDYPLNPAEGFVLGGAILLHDAALCFEAYQDGQTGLRKTIEWKDAFASINALNNTSSLTEKENEADFAAMRLLHASQASKLGLEGWTTPEGDLLYLIENYEIRKHYGKLIGDIASSHHWSIEDVASKLQAQVNAPTGLPRDWRVDPIKIACLLRCADAAHLDSRRAPDFLRALANLHGVSANHWTAQNWLERADHDTSAPEKNALIYTSGKTFDEVNAEAWWVAFDAIQLVDRELTSSAALLKRRPQVEISPPFQMRRVTGASSPAAASKTIKTVGWTPRGVEIHVGNLERLISKLGGEKLYGEEQSIIIVLRELIQNARDATIARSAIDHAYEGSIRVTHETDGHRHTLIVEDGGVGMSDRVMTGPLLDFGASFWASDLARSEFPSLLSSGYRPIGKFGIGFYSIFMVASSASVASRRFDAAHNAVTQIRFPNGLSLRPVVVTGAPVGFGYSTSTRVEIQLKPDQGNPETLVIRKGRPGYEEQIRLPLSQCLAILCAGLDVPVELVEQNGVASIVHSPLSELDTEEKRRTWLYELAGPEKKREGDKLLDAYAKRLRPIVKDGRTYGMAALSTARLAGHGTLGMINTVGGLASSISLSDLSRFVGSIDFEPNSAKRDATLEPSAGQEALEIWADEQKRLIPSRANDPTASLIATCSLADMQIDPIDIATIMVRTGDSIQVFDIDQAVDLICTTGLAFYQSPNLAHTEVYHSQGPFGAMPTFWPIINSSFISLERDESGKARITSILSCIERRAEERGIEIIAQYSAQTVAGHFGAMPVLLLHAKRLS